MCGLAGALLANNTDFISPAVMYWTRSGDLMVMVILGGMGSLFGPVIGAVVFLVLEEFLSQVAEYWALIMGPLVRLFGGIVPTDNVSLAVADGELHSIIGPNGAGKTTLISQLTGQLTPHAGAIYLAGRDVSRLPAWRRSALGLARS